CYFTNFSGAYEYAYDLEDLGAYYRLYEELMRHWKSVLRVPILEVRYEDMVAEQERTSRRLVEFCGLEWQARCLAFHENKREVATASFDQVRKPVYRASVGRWRHYAAHLDPLRQALGLASEREERK
ncbi:MAG TPA: sulfotransferase, partial [Chromatiales bacterium]|nr:sulfotransferase [Chromatiales bacterium]